ncbi:hypothetical protein GCM10025768_15690 [Microbacterium pseudoresistens]|uniref:Uncharacterized protein n=1 Tax=Microbacterium pseudoresistens TaxID=640634 RepID=A0A7Y9JMY7_9MICO|nr:hypothetical protein [Microbacterium pseudoresistens]
MSDPVAASGSHPQFGEYASPEEQARRAGRSIEPVADAEPSTSAPTARPGSASTASAAPRSSAGEARRTHPADRIITLALLGYGLFTVVSSAVAYSDMTTLMNQALSMMGAQGEFTNHAQGKLWGIIAAVVLIAGWTLTAGWAAMRLRAGRSAWWVPLVGAVVFTVAASVCLTVPLLGDPAFLDALNAGAGGAS